MAAAKGERQAKTRQNQRCHDNSVLLRLRRRRGGRTTLTHGKSQLSPGPSKSARYVLKRILPVVATTRDRRTKKARARFGDERRRKIRRAR